MAFEVKMPQLGLTMEEGTVGNWLKKEGDSVKVGEALVEIETDKLTTQVESEFEGVLLKIVAPQGTEVPVQGVIAYIGKVGESVGTASAQAPAPSAQQAAPAAVAGAAIPAAAAKTGGPGGRIKISPLAKKTAAKMGIDYSALSGSGPGGRIVQKDILAAPKTPAAASASAAPLSSALPGGSMGLTLMDGDEVVRIAGMRKTVAHRMFKSATETPAVTTNSKIDVTKLLELRKKLNEEMEKKYSINDFILKAVAKALQKHRCILVAWDGDRIIQRAHINLGMAVALDAGLIVPVIRDADRMGLDTLSDAAKDLAGRARSGQLGPDEYQGSTFTISNMGMYGVESFTPIINQPDAAILGVCAVQDELAMDDDGKVFKKKVMRISLTWDHRLLDGSNTALFQKTIADLLENPMSILV
jgi:pyruvate dehydrogenase E2 component (dihydrolipoamide acetyltransferase)